MKKITSLLIVCSLALVGAVMAQEPSPEQSPSKKQPPKKEQPAATKPPAHAPKSETPAVKEQPAPNQAPAMTPPTTMPETKAPKNKKNMPATTPKTNSEQSATNATTSATPEATKQKPPRNNKNSKTPAADANTSPSATAAASPKTKAKSSPAAATTTATPAPTTATTPPATTPASTTPAAVATTPPTAAATSTPATAPATSAAPSVSQNPSTNVAATKKPDVQKIQQIKQQHTSFRAQPKPERVPAVTFSANFRLPGSERWQGPQYEVYRSYHPERHDRGWYHSHYQRVELIAGGYYYFNSGYWYPAWGYSPSEEYYAYDAPIYVGKRAEPPDRVIADVQAALQEMGYYKGEVDGLLGPLTREALTGYQTDNGMAVTAVIDEPTLDSLGMS
jgi:hypothetical protein